MTMKKYLLKGLWLSVAALFMVSCSEDEVEVVTPKLSLVSDVVEIAENATSALQVTLTADKALETDYTVAFTLDGTAVEGVNFAEMAEKSVTMAADQTEATIFINPKNVSAIEEDKTLSITLVAGELYELDADTKSVTVTITDNKTPASDAPTVSFTSSNIVTNPYLEEEFEVNVGISVALASEIKIPLSFSSELVNGTDYEIEGLDENNNLTIAANATSASFAVKMINSGVANIDQTMQISFADPVVTDYAVKATENIVEVNAVDPQVDFSIWFNEANLFGYFQDDWTTSEMTYRTDLIGYDIKRYYWNEADAAWKSLSGDHYFSVSETDNNQWKEVINTIQKVEGGRFIYTADFVRNELQAGDFLGFRKYFTNEATYGQTLMVSEEGWLRFVTTDASETEGVVVIPEQTLTLYKIKEGYDWAAKTTVQVDVDGELKDKSYYAWYADSRATQGDLSKSENVTPVSISVERSEGTYNTSTGEIFIDVTFTCDDADMVIDPQYYSANNGNSYTLKLKYIFAKAQE